MPPDHLQENECAVGIHREIGERLAGGPVVRGLRGGVDHQVDRTAMRREQLVHRPIVANVGVDMAVTADARLQQLPPPRRAAIVTEEVAAQIVVDADDIEALAGEEPAWLRIR